MPEWQERIVRDTRPAIRAEHDLRYAAAAPIVLASPVWCDLGCGSGVAAADELGDRFDGHAVLVDVAQDALDEATAIVHAGATTSVHADLSSDEDLRRVREAVLAAGADGTVTCFEVVEHLESFAGLLRLLRDLADDHGFTVVLSVPNDAFWALENPYHRTMWGAGAFEELRRLLPDDHVVARQVPLSGSALVVGEGKEMVAPGAIAVEPERVPSHHLVAFGPRAGELAAGARAQAADLDGQRTWERQREANLAFLEAEVAELRARVRSAGAQPRWQRLLARALRRATSGERP
jgi:SAM-dependent methyltransferase